MCKSAHLKDSRLEGPDLMQRHHIIDLRVRFQQPQLPEQHHTSSFYRDTSTDQFFLKKKKDNI